MIFVLFGLNCCDPDGGIWHLAHSSRHDFADLFAGFLLLNTLVLWLVLGFQLFMGLNAETPRWAAILAVVATLLTFAAAFAAIDLRERYHGWAIVVPVLLPPLIGLYAIWARFRRPPGKFTSVIWAAILVLTIAPFPLTYLDALTYPDREPVRTAEFRLLTPESTLRDYFDFRPYEPRRDDWFEAVRRVKSRETDAVMLLKEGPLKNRELASKLWRLDLEVTPSLCEAFHERLREVTAKIDPITLTRGSGDSSVYSALTDVWFELRTIKWLVGGHCDLSDTLTDIETKLRPLSPPVTIAYQITDILNTLATLRQTH